MKYKMFILAVLAVAIIAIIAAKPADWGNESGDNANVNVDSLTSASLIAQAKQQKLPAWLLFHSTT